MDPGSCDYSKPFHCVLNSGWNFVGNVADRGVLGERTVTKQSPIKLWSVYAVSRQRNVTSDTVPRACTIVNGNW